MRTTLEVHTSLFSLVSINNLFIIRGFGSGKYSSPSMYVSTPKGKISFNLKSKDFVFISLPKMVRSKKYVMIFHLIVIFLIFPRQLIVSISPSNQPFLTINNLSFIQILMNSLFYPIPIEYCCNKYNKCFINKDYGQNITGISILLTMRSFLNSYTHISSTRTIFQNGEVFFCHRI